MYVCFHYQSIIHGSDHGHDEDCTDMRPHMAGWNDEKCWINLNYICEMETYVYCYLNYISEM